MWLTITMLVMVLGICMMVYGKCIDSSENYKALSLMFFGVILIGGSGISGLFLVVFG